MAMNFGLVDANAPERMVTNALAAGRMGEQDQRNALLFQGRQEDRLTNNALRSEAADLARQNHQAKLLPLIGQAMYADPSDQMVDMLAGTWMKATGQDVSQMAENIKMMPPEQRREVAKSMITGGAVGKDIKAFNLGDRYQAFSVNDGGMTPVGSSVPIADKQQKGAAPYYQFLPTPQGIVVGNARSGELSLGDINGRPVVKSSDDPALQGSIAREKEFGKTTGEDAAKSQIEAPKIEAQAEETVRLVDELLKHPGKSMAVGASRLARAQMIPGTDAKAFDVRLEQLKGKQFLEAFNSLRGGGQITEVEGVKATNAMSRMNPESTEEEFDKAAEEFKGIVKLGLERARKKAATNKPVASGIPQVNAKGWKLYTDGSGNRAYVHPNGQEFEEVK